MLILESLSQFSRIRRPAAFHKSHKISCLDLPALGSEELENVVNGVLWKTNAWLQVDDHVEPFFLTLFLCNVATCKASHDF